MLPIDASNDSGLIRGLGIWAATAVVIGAMVGQAIFLVPSQVARDVGSEIGGLVVWLTGGLVVLSGGFCYAELGAAMPEAGGEYVYLTRGLGPVWGFLYGWTSALIMRPGSAATIAAGLLRLTAFLLPSVATPIFTWHIPVLYQPYQFTFTAAQPSAAAVVAGVTAINYFGVRTAGRIQIVLSGLKIAAVLTIVVLGFALGRVSGLHSGSLDGPFASGTAGAFLTALVPVMAAYNGFQHLGWVGGEIIDPQKNIPRAAVWGVSSVAGFYLLINLAYFRVLPFSQVAQSQHVASDAIALLTGQSGAKWMTIAMMISTLGALHVNFLTGPRVVYAMARDGQFFSFAKRIQPTHHTPSGALVFQGCVSTLLVLTGTFEELYSLTILAIWIFFVLTAVALIRLRINEPTLRRPYLAWGYPWTPVLFAGAAIVMTANLWLVRPARPQSDLP